MGTYQITEIALNDHAFIDLWSKAEYTHPSVGTILMLIHSIVSCPHFNNYAGDLVINVSLGDTLVGDFVATVSDGDDVTYSLER